VLSLAVGCGDQPTAGAPIPLAATFNLTGQMGEYDVPVEQAVRLAIKQRNSAGGINGRQIEYKAFDGASDAGQAQTATNAALNSGAVAIIGFDDTSSILNAAPLIQKAGIPYITAGATSPRLLVLAGSSIFLEAYGDNVQAAAAAEFAYDRLHSRRVAVLTNIGQEYSSGLSRYFGASWNKLVPGGVVFPIPTRSTTWSSPRKSAGCAPSIRRPTRSMCRPPRPTRWCRCWPPCAPPSPPRRSSAAIIMTARQS
jgi:ABC-type branched-subunit amino acid transport system substrate-binding protein